MTRYDFAFVGRYRLAALPFGITPSRTGVELDAAGLRVRFGPWRLTTDLDNLDSATRSGGFGFLKTAGPPHLSFADRGITFATNATSAVCLTFHAAVPGIDPTGTIRHPGATLTLADVDGFLRDLAALQSR